MWIASELSYGSERISDCFGGVTGLLISYEINYSLNRCRKYIDVDVDGDDSVDDNTRGGLISHLPISIPVNSGNPGHISSGVFDRSKGLKEWVPVNYKF